MRRRTTLGMLAVTALLVGACSGGPTSTPGSSTVPASTAEASATAAAPTLPPASSAAEATAAPTSLDPCQLVTASEASALAGATFSSGKESTTSGGAKMCTYGGQTMSVVNVLVTEAPDAATAQADWSQEQAKAQAALEQGVPAGMTLSFKLDDASVTGADKAAVATAQASLSGVTVSISAIYVLKGSTFFTFSDLAVGHLSASTSALEAQAVTTLTRVP